MLALFIGALVVISITHWIYSWRNPGCNGKLPPGSMGLPLLGETLQFLTPNTTYDISPFVKERMERYGPTFRTSLFGRPIVITTDPDLSCNVFLREGQLFQAWYPKSFMKIIGEQNIGSLHGFMHKYLKNIILSLFGLESLKRMVPEIEKVSHRSLQQWSQQGSIDIKEEIAKMIFHLTTKKLISHDTDQSEENLRANFDAFEKGLLSFPFEFPGTSYHKCMQGRRNALKMLRKLLEERRRKTRKEQSDFFDYVLEELHKEGTNLTEAIALDLMFALLFVSFETTSLALISAIKFLSDHPLVLKQLTDEHKSIMNKRENADSKLTWEEYKSMKFTFQFINETLRLANIVPGMFRKALKDIQFKGYAIPAGWGVVVCPAAIHLDPNVYEDPLSFNPSRWDGDGVHGASKHFVAFGGGTRFCIGADFAKVQMAVFLHNWVTKYRWQVIKGGNFTQKPGLQFPDGFHIKVMEKEKGILESPNNSYKY